MGLSPENASTVPMVLNLGTGTIVVERKIPSQQCPEKDTKPMDQ